MAGDAAPAFRWGHINLTVRNLERSVAFYARLGFSLYLPGIPYLGIDNSTPATAVTPDAAAALGLGADTRARACILQPAGGGYPKIDLTEYAGDTADLPHSPTAPGLARLCLLCSNVALACRDLGNAGVEFITPPQAGENAMVTLAVCRDPDGVEIELLEIHRDRWPQNR